MHNCSYLTYHKCCNICIIYIHFFFGFGFVFYISIYRFNSLNRLFLIDRCTTEYVPFFFGCCCSFHIMCDLLNQCIYSRKFIIICIERAIRSKSDFNGKSCHSHEYVIFYEHFSNTISMFNSR